MKKLSVLLLIIIFYNYTYSQSNPKTDHARQLLELTGTIKIAIQTMDNMTASFKKSLPAVPTEFWDEFSKEVNPNDLIELVIPIYCKHYSDDEMLKLIEFYKSPLGQKVIEKLPLISQDSYMAGQEWGRKVGEKAVIRLKEKGFILDN